MNISEQKKILRKELIARRQSLLASGHKQASDERIFANLLCNDSFRKAKAVLTYISEPIEADTRRLIDYCFQHGIAVAVPRCTKTEMSFFVINSMDDVKAGMYGIPEPLEYCFPADERMFGGSVCIVPGLCFDLKGFRLGYGKGYYDKFLSGYNGYSIGLCYNEFMTEEVISDKYDLNVNCVITDF